MAEAEAQYAETSEVQSHKAWVEGEDAVEIEGRDFAGDGNDVSEYVGTDPEYRNYASETDRPLTSDATAEVLDSEDDEGEELPKAPVKDKPKTGPKPGSTPTLDK